MYMFKSLSIKQGKEGMLVSYIHAPLYSRVELILGSISYTNFTCKILLIIIIIIIIDALPSYEQITLSQFNDAKTRYYLTIKYLNL